ncbi:MAG: hypothetical protein B6I20_02480 [Bacteroidetes bacterium 4572_117]|nr:MAG: hypothetical protein B6I20_02480 [Bacteroidetes bacterium 4572_117]
MKKVLIIIGQRQFRNELVSFISFEGYEVISAKDGVEGLQKALQFKPDIIVSNIKMSRLNGYDLLRTLKQIKITREIPFIFLSAKNQASDVRNALLLGADDYLIKPLNPSCIVHSIRLVLIKQKKRTQQFSIEEFN